MRNPLCRTHPVVLSALLLASAASAQLAHLGPSGIIKLSQTLPTYDVSTVKQLLRNWRISVPQASSSCRKPCRPMTSAP